MAKLPPLAERDPTLDAVDAAIEGRVISRKEAKEKGLAKYFTGNPCIHGHISERYAKTAICIECCKINNKLKNGTRNEYHKRWKSKNKQRHRELNKISRDRNIEAYRARARIYSKNNPNVVRVCAQNRRARKLAAPGRHTLSDINMLLDKQKHRCANCRKGVNKSFHVDHIQPLSKGGSNDKANLQILCPHCNLSKHSLDPFDWANKNGKLL